MYSIIMAVALVFVSCGGKWIVDRHEEIVDACDLDVEDDGEENGEGD